MDVAVALAVDVLDPVDDAVTVKDAERVLVDVAVPLGVVVCVLLVVDVGDDVSVDDALRVRVDVELPVDVGDGVRVLLQLGDTLLVAVGVRSVEFILHMRMTWLYVSET